MTADKTIPIILTVLFLVFAIPAALYFRKPPATVLTPSEKALTSFSNKPVAMASLQAQITFSGRACPVTLSPKTGGISSVKSATTISPPVAVTNSAKKSPARSLASLPVISMISYDESSRTAIIDNKVVNEGSKLDGGLIVKIERTRVLMRKAGKDLWLTLE